MITLETQQPNNKFTIIDNAFHLDYDLSNGAFRLLFHLLYLPQNWQINWNQIAKTLKTSLRTIERYRGELIKKGILQKQRVVYEGKISNHLEYKISSASELEVKEKIEEVNGEAILEATEMTSDKNGNAYTNNNTESINKTKNNKKAFFVSQFFGTKILQTTLESYSHFKSPKQSNLGFEIEDYFNDEEKGLVAEWVAHKRKFKVSGERILKELLKSKEEGRLLESIEHSLNNGYRGLYPPKSFGNALVKPAQKHHFSDEELLEILEG